MEEPPVPGEPEALEGAAERQRPPGRGGAGRAGRALRVHRRPLLRHARDRGAGQTSSKGPWADPDYKARREGAFIVTVNCAKAGGTCFCVSMETGPKATFGFDLSLTELLDDHGHRFLVEVGSERGGGAPGGGHAAVRGRRRAGGGSCDRRDRGEQGRSLDTTDIRDLLYRNREHPRWDEVADRCLTCGNCTLACPTCLQQRRGRDRPRRRGGHPRAQVGVEGSSTPTCTAAACAAGARLAIASG